MNCGTCKREPGEGEDFYVPVLPKLDPKTGEVTPADAYALCRDCYRAQYQERYERDPFAED